jgi:predicted PurR-regulated permease PerM
MGVKYKRFFEGIIAVILVFLLLLLLSKAEFIFLPIFKVVTAVALPIVGAGILYYLTKPLVVLLEELRINRVLSILAVFVFMLILAILFLLFIWPIVRDQTINLVERIPAVIYSLQDVISYWQANDVSLPEQLLDTINHFISQLPTYLENMINYLFAFVGGFIGQVISFVAGIVLIPFFLFFMLKDREKFIPFLTKFFKPKKKEFIHDLLSKVDDVLAAFIQGQLVVSFFVGILLFVGYTLIGLEYALALSLFGMLTNVIPYLGPFIAVAPAILIGALQDPFYIIWVSIIMIVAQQIESTLISPNIMGQVLHLHPLTIITVILAAGSIAGFLGILFAVPVYAVIRTVIIHFYETYRDNKEKPEDALF